MVTDACDHVLETVSSALLFVNSITEVFGVFKTFSFISTSLSFDEWCRVRLKYIRFTECLRFISVLIALSCRSKGPKNSESQHKAYNSCRQNNCCRQNKRFESAQGKCGKMAKNIWREIKIGKLKRTKIQNETINPNPQTYFSNQRNVKKKFQINAKLNAIIIYFSNGNE